MNKPKIVFMGTPDFAVAILEKLILKKFNVVAIVTVADKPAGRGRKLNESAVKKFGSKLKIPILQPLNLKDQQFIKDLASYQADLQIVVAFRMLPKIVWEMPKLGTINLHASLLPLYRGAAPIHWAIINGETKTGVTTFFIDDKIDTGDIILNQETEILPDETVGELHDKLMCLGADLVCKTVELIYKGDCKTKKQPNLDTKLAPKLTQENTKIDWKESVEIVYNKIRGLNPFPAAWTQFLNGDEIITAKIYDVEKIEINHDELEGKIFVDNDGLKIATKKGFILIKEIKLSGKKKMNSKSLLNGFRFKEDAIAL